MCSLDLISPESNSVHSTEVHSDPWCNSKHWFTTSFLRRKVPESGAGSVPLRLCKRHEKITMIRTLKILSVVRIHVSIRCGIYENNKITQRHAFKVRVSLQNVELSGWKTIRKKDNGKTWVDGENVTGNGPERPWTVQSTEYWRSLEATERFLCVAVLWT